MAQPDHRLTSGTSPDHAHHRRSRHRGADQVGDRQRLYRLQRD